jgi:hypothetical protein
MNMTIAVSKNYRIICIWLNPKQQKINNFQDEHIFVRRVIKFFLQIFHNNLTDIYFYFFLINLLNFRVFLIFKITIRLSSLRRIE